MFVVMNTAKLTSVEIDDECFKSTVTISKAKKREQNRGDDEDNSKTLLRRIKGTSRLLPEGILALANYCQWLCELSLSYTLLSDELLLALCSIKKIHLETLRIEAYPEEKPLPHVSDKVWSAFSDHLPDVNLVLLSYVIDDNDQELLFTSCIPVTHLYLGEAPSESIMMRISERCPRLMELVIASFGPGLIDRFLISAAKSCTRLNAIGLGDCEITCSGLVRFVALCSSHLQTLYIAETSLIEDAEFDIPKISANVSSLLGRMWIPEYVPLW